MRILVISVHPDDETLGCGGTMLRHVESGDEIYWLIATQGHPPQWSPELLDEKAAEVGKVAAAYRVKGLFKLGLPTVRLDTLPQADLINRLREVIDQVKPEIVYLVHDGDVHSDHHAIFQAALCVLKAFYM